MLILKKKMGGQQSVHEGDIAMPPLFYDTRKIPKSAYHMADKMFEYMENPSLEERKQVESTFPSCVTVTEADLIPYKTERKFYRIKRTGDIFQVISHDPKCLLHMNDRQEHLGVGTFSFLHVMAWATDFFIEHGTNLKSEDATSLPLQIKYFNLEDDVKSCFPNTANFKLNNVIIGMGATGRLEKPIFDVIKGDYKPKYRRTNYVVGEITSLQIEQFVDNPRLKDYVCNDSYQMIYLTMLAYIKVSVPVEQQSAFVDFLNETLGERVQRNQVMKGGYNLVWADQCALEEIEQDQEEIARQKLADAKVKLIKVESNFKRLIDADVFTYELPY
jgi:hypothetical protein